ncbi:MAG: 4-hydroxy-tetrahydrodipicolinate reductase, partial [Tepidisphaeraceae bacterium]
MITIAITGAGGRMGQRLVALAARDDALKIVAALERAECGSIGRDAGQVAGIGAIGIPVASELQTALQVLIDFTVPAGTRHWLQVCRERGIAMVIGTTGLIES